MLELPYTARSEYVLYRWNDVFDNAEKIRSMVDRLRFQVECFNEALPYEAGQSYGDRAASASPCNLPDFMRRSIT